MPQISICLTTYNRGAVLPATIRSILNQTYTDFELIISDDNSTDNTTEICERFVKEDNRVRYFRNPVNLKMPGNLNNAISKATGDFIANLHDGDIYRPELIAKWHETLVRHPDALFVFNQYQLLDKMGRKIGIVDHGLDEINDGRCLFEYFYKNLSSAPWGTVMARKEAYIQYGMFDPAYGFISDVEMWLRLGKKGKVCYVSEPLIELTPRETDHKYYLPYWGITYLNLSVLYKYYMEETANVQPDVIKRGMKKHLFQSVLILIKHHSVGRVREYLYLVFASPFISLKFLLCPLTFLIPKKPEGFDPGYWKRICVLH